MIDILDFINLIKGPTAMEVFEMDAEEFKESEPYLDVNEWSSSSKIIEEIFTLGCCGRFALILKEVYPEGECFKLKERCHIIFKYNNKYYDITGDVTDEYNECEMYIVDKEYISENIYDNNYSFKDRGPII